MRIAIIAHDGKKAEMVRFLMDHREVLSAKGIDLVATGTTGQHALDAGFEVERVMSGPLGGDAQIASQVTEGKIQMVFFFRDPLDKHPHEPDIAMLMRICDVRNIPLATNIATAERLLHSF
ncbi:MAG: methylglyoxal synthase [Cryomorphaceae bacterium]|nr:methylglyoxal synthase [Cryomorphaceae bacterium]